jgi:hypothetical protein
MKILCWCYLVKWIQAILVLTNEDLVGYRVCGSLLEGIFVIVDNCSVHVLDCTL